MVHDEVRLAERVDFVGVATQLRHLRPHRGQVDYGGHAGEVLQKDAGGLEGDFDILLRGLPPVDDRVNVGDCMQNYFSWLIERDLLFTLNSSTVRTADSYSTRIE